MIAPRQATAKKKKYLVSAGRLFGAEVQLWLALVTGKAESVHSGAHGRQGLTFLLIPCFQVAEGRARGAGRRLTSTGELSVALWLHMHQIPCLQIKDVAWFAGPEASLFPRFLREIIISEHFLSPGTRDGL